MTRDDRPCRWVPLVAALFPAFAPAAALAGGFSVAKGSEVSFHAKITAGSFVGKSEAVLGTVEYDEATSTVKRAAIAVRCASFETGMSLRDKHMREKYLECSKHPELRFEVAGAKFFAHAGASGSVQGTFTVRGVSRRAELNISVASGSGGRVVATSRFPVDVTDFGIPQPKFAFVKMDARVEVSVRLVLQPRP